MEKLVEIWFLDQISGPPVGCRSAVRRGAIFLATVEGQRCNPSLREWKANFKSHCQNLEAALYRGVAGGDAEGPFVVEDMRP